MKNNELRSSDYDGALSGTAESQIKLNKFRQIYLPVGFIGLMILFALWYVMNTGSRIAKHYFPLINATMEIKLEATTAHLWFEEIITGDRDEDIDKVWSHINRAEWFARAMLEGGENAEGVFISLNDPELREDILVVLEQIKEFRSIARDRYPNSEISIIGFRG